MKSTSIHNLNADRGLNLFEKLAYLFLNWVNNLFPYFNVDERIEIRYYNDPKWRDELENTYETSSVGRRLSDLFWRTLPWDKIQEELGEIHVFDTGCGQGNYSTRLQDASGGRLASYTGIDAKKRPNWDELEKKHPNFKFIESSSSDIFSLIPPKTNLFITQSAIEHFDEDLVFFEKIRDFIIKTGKPVIQIHNFPGAAILPLYHFHGIRQYIPRTISKITRLFERGSLLYLYGLGGRAGKKVQFKYFTWPLLILRKNKGAKWPENASSYNKEVVQSIEYDIENPVKSPIFWVLIIHSNQRQKIW
jgi:SAM-dependent methyltransferase